MRRRHDPMRNVVWNVWTEPIDGQAYAACAEAHEVHRGNIFAASTFLLTPTVGEGGKRIARWEAMELAREKLTDEMRRGVHRKLVSSGVYLHRFGMPVVGFVRDLRR